MFIERYVDKYFKPVQFTFKEVLNKRDKKNFKLFMNEYQLRPGPIAFFRFTKITHLTFSLRYRLSNGLKT